MTDQTTGASMSSESPGAVGSQVERVVRLADPERAAYARWLADTHAPALRRMDSDGAHAAGYSAGVAAERERFKLNDAHRKALFAALSKSQMAEPEWRVEIDLALLRALGEMVFGPNVGAKPKTTAAPMPE